MSDLRLETGDCDQRRPTLPLPSCDLRELVKIEEIHLGLPSLFHAHSSPEPPAASPALRASPAAETSQLRAHYAENSLGQRVAIESRVLEWEQKAPRAGAARAERAGATVSNETKNIAKNYGKAIIAFMQRNKRLFRAICRATATPYQRIAEELPELKASLTTVMGFRQVWTAYKYAECMRMVSQVFLSRGALPYVFNSKVANVQTHLKYRARFLKALRNPAAFDHIKDY